MYYIINSLQTAYTLWIAETLKFLSQQNSKPDALQQMGKRSSFLYTSIIDPSPSAKLSGLAAHCGGDGG